MATRAWWLELSLFRLILLVDARPQGLRPPHGTAHLARFGHLMFAVELEGAGREELIAWGSYFLLGNSELFLQSSSPVWSHYPGVQWVHLLCSFHNQCLFVFLTVLIENIFSFSFTVSEYFFQPETPIPQGQNLSWLCTDGPGLALYLLQDTGGSFIIDHHFDHLM